MTARINHRGRWTRVVVRNRKHWSVIIGRAWVERWCPGAPCSLPDVKYARHGIRVGVNP